MDLFVRLARHAYEMQRRVQRRLHARRIAGRLKDQQREPTGEVRRVVVVCIGLLGDTIMTVPALRALRMHYAQAHLTAVVLPHTAEFLRAQGVADEVVVAYGSVYGWRSPVRRNRALLAQIFERGAFDVGVVLLGHDFAGLLVEAGVSTVVGPADSYFAPFFAHRFELDARTWTPEAQLRAIRLLGFQQEVASVPTLTPAADLEERAHSVLRRAHVSPGANYLVLHPYAGSASRSLPADWRTRMAAALNAATGLPVLVVGRTAQQERLESSANVHDLTNQLNIPELMAVLAGAAAVVSTDSGPLHLAAALGLPVIGLFRSIRPELAGVYPNVTPLFGHGPPSCMRECSWDSYAGCRHQPCAQLLSLSENSILDAVLGVVRCASR